MTLIDSPGPLIVIGCGLILSFVLTGLALVYARRRGLIDHPGDRHSHTVATPRGGGVGLIAAILVTSVLFHNEFRGFWSMALLPCTVAIALLGWWDDHSSLSAKFRFLVQAGVSIVLLGCIVIAGWSITLLPMILSGLFLLWMTNMYNFMDGSNGMAGSQGVFGGVVVAVLYLQAGNHELALASALLAAACLGFLPWNLGNAKIFMGDTGSLALGFAFGSLLIHGVFSASFSLPVALLVMLVFLTDASLTLLVRVLRREQWYNAHRQHLYQRLIASGWTHNGVMILYLTINLLLVVPGIILALNFPALAWIVTLSLILMSASGWYLMKKRTGALA